MRANCMYLIFWEVTIKSFFYFVHLKKAHKSLVNIDVELQIKVGTLKIKF